MIFVDTSAWFAAFVPNDPDAAAADAWLAANAERLVTTDYIVDELLALLKVRNEFERTRRLGARILDDSIARLEWMTPFDIQAAWSSFRGFQDKQWSFTDCVSRAVMQRLKIPAAFAFDDHFRQFGTVSVVPERSR